MRLKTILNRIQAQPGFVYEAVRLVAEDGGLVIEAVLRPRALRRPTCSGCTQPGPGYDTLARRRFAFVPLWGLPVFFCYAMRRVACPTCGVRVETVPWAAGKHQLTTTYAWFLARWAKRLSWTEVAGAFRTTWEHVFRSVEMAVAWGRQRQDLTGIAAIGVDELQWRRGHHYLTLVYQLDAGAKRLLWLGEHRQVKTLLRFFRWLGPERSAALRFICSDMWKPYLRVVAKKAGQAIHILDRFHIMSHLSKAIDEVRAQEARALKAQGRAPILTHPRWLLLKRPEHLTDPQEERLAELLRYNLKAVRAYLLKEDFQFFWHYISPHWAGGAPARCAPGSRPCRRSPACSAPTGHSSSIGSGPKGRCPAAPSRASTTRRGSPPGGPTDSGPFAPSKSPSTIRLGLSPNRRLPTDSAEEAFFLSERSIFARAWPQCSRVPVLYRSFW